MAKDKPTDKSEPTPVSSETTLSGPVAPLTDTRPRFEPITVAELGGELRLRRLQPEQVVALRRRFHGIRKPSDLVAANRRQACHLARLCLVGLDSGTLLLPGDAGLRRMEAISSEALLTIVTAVDTMNELFAQ